MEKKLVMDNFSKKNCGVRMDQRREVKYVLSTYEKKTRKLWLFFTFFTPIFYMVFLAIPLLFTPLDQQTVKAVWQSIFFVFIQSVAFWQCAYVKFGTKLITWNLVLSPLVFGGIIYVIKEMIIGSGYNFSTMIFIFGMLSYAGWLYMTVKIRKLNKEIQNLIPEVVLV